MSEKTMQTTMEPESRTRPPVTRDERRHVTPPVDIYETEDGLTVIADLPGVEKDGLNVHVDEDVLTIEGRVYRKEKTPTIAEFELADYFRQFRLSELIDPGRITAELRHGVLTIQLPKLEAVKPRQIEVKVG